MEFAEIETHNRGETTGVKSSGGGDGGGGKGSQWGNGASPGKIFIGDLSRETTTAQFLEHFGAYGEITDNVIIKDRNTGLPRGFGFITYADPAVVDQVIEDSHVINGKQVEIKRTIPKGSGGGEEFKTKKIFVGGIPATLTEDELRDFFSKFGEITEHQIMKDPVTGRARGFGFVMFDNEKPVDDILSRGNKLDMGGVQDGCRVVIPGSTANVRSSLQIAELSNEQSKIPNSFLEDMMNSCSMFQELSISHWSSLMHFPTGLPTTLRKLDISYCKRLEFPSENMLHNFNFLERLHLKSSCDSMRSFPLGFFPRLKSLLIEGCMNLESFSILDPHREISNLFKLFSLVLATNFYLFLVEAFLLPI